MIQLINAHTAPTRDVTEDGAQGARVRDLAPATQPTGATLDLWEIAPGGQGPSHHHPEEHFCYVLAGEGTLYGNAEAPPIPLRAGAALYIGPGERHRAVNSGRTPLQILVCTPLVADEAPRQATLTAMLAEAEPPPLALQLLLIFDGGSQGNPGHGYGSFYIEAPGRKPHRERRDYEGQITSNEAEYLTLIAALEYILGVLEASGRDPKQVELDIRGDSKLVVSQVKGEWKIKNARMRDLADKCHLLLRRFGRWHLTWHERGESVAVLGH